MVYRVLLSLRRDDCGLGRDETIDLEQERQLLSAMHLFLPADLVHLCDVLNSKCVSSRGIRANSRLSTLIFLLKICEIPVTPPPPPPSPPITQCVLYTRCTVHSVLWGVELVWCVHIVLGLLPVHVEETWE